MAVRRMFALLVLIAAVVVAPPAPTSADDPPNVVVVVVDDLSRWMWDSHLGDWPNISALAAAGRTYDKAYMTTPLCGPVRASLMTARMAHNTGVLTNGGYIEAGSDDRGAPPGGYDVYANRNLHAADLPVQMQSAGYSTYLVGKYLHTSFPATMVPPGWDDFRPSFGAKYFFTQRADNGVVENLGPGQYRLDAEAADMASIISGHGSGPYFAYLALFGPHLGAVNNPGGEFNIYPARHAAAYAGATVPVDPDSGIPLRAGWPSTAPDDPDQHNQYYRAQLRAMKAVDDAVGTVMAEVDLDDTLVMLVSDNGIFLGQRGTSGKRLPYQRSTHVPMVMAGPGVTPGSTSSDLVAANLDLAPTVMAAGGLTPPGTMQGYDLRSPPAQLRTHILAEGYGLSPRLGGNLYNTEWTAAITADSSVMAWSDGVREAFDLTADPFETTDVWGTLNAAEQAEAEALFVLAGRCRVRGCTTQRETVITSPLPRSPAPDSGGWEITGASWDPGGAVAQPRVIIRRADTGEYLNAAWDWQPGWTFHSPTLDAAQSITTWSMTVPIAMPPGANVHVSARSDVDPVSSSHFLPGHGKNRIGNAGSLAGTYVLPLQTWEPSGDVHQGWALDWDGIASITVDGVAASFDRLPSNDRHAWTVTNIDAGDGLTVAITDLDGDTTVVEIDK